ncbi:MAG: hypothetical protein SFV53_06650 [Rickettsiales bacterium]|nr:hypothetical protein [Rickettsiales bacterium]
MSISQQTLKKLTDNDKSLIDLIIKDSEIGAEGAKILAKALENNTVLQSLELGNSNIGAQGAAAFADILSKKSALKTLYLRGAKIGDEGAKSLAKALLKNKVLEHLYLGGNEITLEGVKALSESLTKNFSLKTIYLRNNNVGDEGTKILADALSKNYTLSVLNLANTNLTAVGCEALIKLLKTNTTLQDIIFEHNGVESPEIINLFAQRLKYNRSISVVTSNCVAKKILTHCEEYFNLQSQNEEDELAALEKKSILSRSEQYHCFGDNLQGNSILCAAFLSHIIFSKYEDKTHCEKLLKILAKLHQPLLERVKKDLANEKVTKPDQEILQITADFIKQF